MAVFGDIIVAFKGARDQSPLTEAEVFPDINLGMYRRKKDRVLLRLGNRTNTILQKSAALIDSRVSEIKAFLQGKDPGKVFVYGSSSGGRNAIDLAVRLTREKVPIELLAPMDAAWFPNETRTVPNMVFFAPPTNVPMFPPQAVVARQTMDVFQIVGNRAKRALRKGSPPVFGSDMDGDEIHGNVHGFTPEDVTAAVKAGNPKDDNDAHVAGIRIGRGKVFDRITAVLSGP